MKATGKGSRMRALIRRVSPQGNVLSEVSKPEGWAEPVISGGSSILFCNRFDVGPYR